MKRSFIQLLKISFSIVIFKHFWLRIFIFKRFCCKIFIFNSHFLCYNIINKAEKEKNRIIQKKKLVRRPKNML